MRKITEQSVRAFLEGRVLNSGNMNVSVVDGDVHLYLHGNLIARSYTVDGGFGIAKSTRIDIMDAGWKSNTTKERLNGLLSSFAPGYGLYQHDFAWYLRRPRNASRPWLGSATFTKDGQLIES